MIIKNILAQLEEATKPVSKIIKTGNAFRALALGLKKGATWADHKAAMPTRLLLIKGSAVYRQGESEIMLEEYEDMEIPVDIIHSLEALDDCICVLIQGFE